MKKSKKKWLKIKKTGKLFSFCCAAPLIIKKKNLKEINKFENIGADIGLLFQLADDLIDYKGNLLIAVEKLKLVKSRSEIKRLIKSNGVKVNDELYKNSNLSLEQFSELKEIKISIGKKKIGILKIL